MCTNVNSLKTLYTYYTYFIFTINYIVIPNLYTLFQFHFIDSPYPETLPSYNYRPNQTGLSRHA